MCNKDGDLEIKAFRIGNNEKEMTKHTQNDEDGLHSYIFEFVCNTKIIGHLKMKDGQI